MFRMKRIFNFHELSPSMQRKAVAKVDRLAVARARYSGEIWSESSRSLAEGARFTVVRNLYREITGLWDVHFANPPSIAARTP